jgi:hypothetical protein
MADHQIALFLFVGLLAFAGSLVIAFWLLAVIRGARSRSWPVVEGHIQSSLTETRSETSDEGRVTVYRPRVRYTYTVGRTDYSSERIDFSDKDCPTASKQSSDRIVDSYPPGDAIRVHYNPKNPQQSVLKSGVATDASFYWAPIVGITYYGIGLGLATLSHSSIVWAVICGASCLGAAAGGARPKSRS